MTPRSWLWCEDNRLALARMPEASIHACITDPPYGLSFMGRGWDHAVPGIDYWKAVLRVLKPGGHLMAFGGTRTHHRLWCAIEDAGFELRDTAMGIDNDQHSVQIAYNRLLAVGVTPQPLWS